MKRILWLVILILLTTNVIEAESKAQHSTGFYIEAKEGDSLYFDIYTYLNNKDKVISIISKEGLNKTIFIHQSGKGFTLRELNNKSHDETIEDILRQVRKPEFATTYLDFLTGEEIVITPPKIMDEIKIDPSIYNIPTLPNEFEDVLWREYPEFVDNLSNHWVNKTDTQKQIKSKILGLLEDVKSEALLSSPITERNFNGIMYRSLSKVIFFGRNADFRNSLFDAYGPQIDYSDRERELHPDLIPLSESIKGSILDDYFTLLFHISNAQLYNKDDLGKVLKSSIEEDFGEVNSINYKIFDEEGNDISIYSDSIFNTQINSPMVCSAVITHKDGITLKPNIIVPIVLKPYIDNEITDITSTTTDFDSLTRKVKILDENGQVIKDTIEEVLIHNITRGVIGKQELVRNQKISYIYISTINPRNDYEVYFKTNNQRWYKLILNNHSMDQYLINEYIREER